MNNKKLKKSVKVIMVGIVAGVISIATTITILALSNSSVKVKNFIGLSKKYVEVWKSENKVNDDQVQYEYIYSEETEENIVMKQSLREGEVLEQDATMIITLSQGADPDKEFALADFSGKTEQEIKDWFTNNKFTNVVYEYEMNDELPESTFISMEPCAGTTVKRSDKVTVKVTPSLESLQVTVPDLSNYSLENIQAWAEENSLTLNIVEEYSDSIENGKVISISVENGAVIKKGDTITITISKGVKPEVEQTTSSASYTSNSSVSSNNSDSTTINGGSENNSGNQNVVEPTVTVPDLNTSFYNGLSASEICEYIAEDTGYSASVGSLLADSSSNPNNVAGIASYSKGNGYYIVNIYQKWN